MQIQHAHPMESVMQPLEVVYVGLAGTELHATHVPLISMILHAKHVCDQLCFVDDC